jgi:uncharacterized protein (TIGR02246 family)
MLMIVRAIAIGCALLVSSPSLNAKEHSSDENAIRSVDTDMVAALNARDVDRWLSHFAEEGAMWPQCEPRVVGKEAIREYIQAYVTLPTFAVAHHIESVVVADSGDLAYVTYTYEMGEPVAERGKDLTVYRKVGNGSWKVAIDMWNTNAPPCH